MSRKGINLMILTASGAMLLPASPGVCQSVDRAKVTKLKSAFLYNFGRFVAWPDGAFADGRSPIIIGVLGDDPFGKVLDATVKGKTARDRAFVIKRFKTTRNANSAELRKCHILYVSKSESDYWEDVFKAVDGAHVLTVGEGSSFATSGGVMAFGFTGDKLSVYVNRKQADRAKLRISAKLLKRAIIVKPGRRAARVKPDETRTVLAVDRRSPPTGAHRPTRPGKN